MGLDGSGRAISAAGDPVLAARALSGVPQSPQKRLPGSASSPQAGHVTGSGAPQSPQ
jgi:hypothetical protein